MSLPYSAMMFARAAHKDQRRKYTGNPYFDHLAEVAGIVASVAPSSLDAPASLEQMLAVAWLHDTVEDTDVTLDRIEFLFGSTVALGVSGLTDVETGNRAERKARGRERLAKCSGWIQTIKCADLISNTASIVQHDPKFAVTYLAEKRALLEVMTKADPRLREMAMQQAQEPPNG